jgi:lysozyme
MTPEMKVKLKALLIKHEDLKDKPYYDSLGNLTIGIGRNLTGRGILPDEISLMFDNDSGYFYGFLSKNFEWFNQLNENRQCALIDMCFMGINSFLEFHKMISALEIGNFELAANEIVNSHYEKEVHQRAHDLAEIIRTGIL